MKIYLIRHGQSKANELNLFLGHGDLDLTNKGYEQAKLTAKYLSKFKIDKIYSSDLKRAYHTAEVCAKLFGLAVIRQKNLRELDCGEWDQLTFEQIKEKYAETFAVFISDMANAYCDGGESVSELQKRIVFAIKEIANDNPDKTIAIFSHAAAIKAFAGYCLNNDLESVNTLVWPSNASVTEVNYIDGEFKMIEYSRDDFMGELLTFLPEKI